MTRRKNQVVTNDQQIVDESTNSLPRWQNSNPEQPEAVAAMVEDLVVPNPEANTGWGAVPKSNRKQVTVGDIEDVLSGSE